MQSTQSGYDRENVNIVDQCQAYDGYFRIDRYRLRHRRFDGNESAILAREVLERGPVVAVLPIDLERRRVVLIEQFRPGAYAAGWQPWLLECIAGVIEDSESEAQAARRESLEESGCQLDQLLPVQRFLSSPGTSSETVMLYAASTDTCGIGGLHGLTESEDIRVHVMAIATAIELLDAGQILNAKTVVALQWLARYEQKLSPQWFQHQCGRGFLTPGE